MRRSLRTALIVVPSVLVVGAVVLLVVSLSQPEASPWPAASPVASHTVTPAPTSSATYSAVPTPLPTEDPVPSPSPTDQVQPEPTPAGPATVTIVSWGADGQSVYASGIVTGDAGDGGACTLTAKSPSGQVLTGRRDAQSTPAAVNCGVIQIAAPAGQWALVLAYESPTASGSSEPTEVIQP